MVTAIIALISWSSVAGLFVNKNKSIVSRNYPVASQEGVAIWEGVQLGDTRDHLLDPVTRRTLDESFFRNRCNNDGKG